MAHRMGTLCSWDSRGRIIFGATANKLRESVRLLHMRSKCCQEIPDRDLSQTSKLSMLSHGKYMINLCSHNERATLGLIIYYLILLLYTYGNIKQVNAPLLLPGPRQSVSIVLSFLTGL